MRTLIVYSTRYGATAEASQEMAKVLREEGFEVKVIDVKKDKVKEISEYDLVLVGSGLQMGKWTGDAEGFLKKFHLELAEKKHALFVSTMKMVSEREGKLNEVEESRKVALEDKVTLYKLNPIALGFFGGLLDFNKMNFIFRKTMGFLKPQLEADGFKEIRPGVYDLRDMNEIRNWTRDLAKKARQ